MKFKTIVIIGVLVTLSAVSSAQEDNESTAYYYEVDSADYETNFGPNTSYYQHGFLSLGMVIPIHESDSLQSTVGGLFFEYGSRGKIKLTNTFALGWEASYQYRMNSLVQDSLKNLLSLGQEFEQQQLKKHLINLGIHLRFNVGRRGNNLGKYLDIGGFSSYVFSSRMVVKSEEDRNTGNFGSSEQRVVFKKLNFTLPIEYGLNARLGLNGFILWGRYRLSESFRKKEEVNNGNVLPNLTPLNIGVQIAF